jgi:hypothetical protein
LQFFSRDFDFEKLEENQYPKKTLRMIMRGCYAEKTNRAGRAFSSPRARIARKLRLRRAFQPIIDILARPVLGESAALPDFAFELVGLSVDLSQAVIGGFEPLLFDLAFPVLTIPFDAVPVHCAAKNSNRLRDSFSGVNVPGGQASSSGSNDDKRLGRRPFRKNSRA